MFFGIVRCGHCGRIKQVYDMGAVPFGWRSYEHDIHMCEKCSPAYAALLAEQERARQEYLNRHAGQNAVGSVTFVKE